ncbi:uncharacterized protein METZ01_LOCUS193878 [marine metagenome]|uniref:Uncharacterized protein n=1 Tax=marine metagenome TaxID=408172 RepID=A0A382DSU7_9ZZZZ
MIFSLSVAMIISLAWLFDAAKKTRSISVLPEISTSAFPESLLESNLAGITII